MHPIGLIKKVGTLGCNCHSSTLKKHTRDFFKIKDNSLGCNIFLKVGTIQTYMKQLQRAPRLWNNKVSFNVRIEPNTQGSRKL